MIIRIEEGEQYPVYRVKEEDDYGDLVKSEVSQEQIDKWNKALEIYNEMQNELKTLYEKNSKFNMLFNRL
jgi:cell shape-determining protein MreC